MKRWSDIFVELGYGKYHSDGFETYRDAFTCSLCGAYMSSKQSRQHFALKDDDAHYEAFKKARNIMGYHDSSELRYPNLPGRWKPDAH